VRCLVEKSTCSNYMVDRKLEESRSIKHAITICRPIRIRYCSIPTDIQSFAAVPKNLLKGLRVEPQLN
jgi:hypothetical protein